MALLVNCALIVFAILVAFAEMGSALDCVYCNSTEYSIDEECVRGSVASKMSCSYDTPCFYAIYSLGQGARVSKIAYRGCMLPGKNCNAIKDQTQRLVRSPIVGDECRVCNSHLCNSSSSLYVPFLAIFMGYVFTKFLH